MIDLKYKTILITGAAGGLGSAMVKEFVDRGAKRVYATGLDLESLVASFQKYGDKVVPIELDVTKVESINKCVEQCSDTTILINNAAVEFKVPFIAERASQAALFEMKVNYIGVIDMINAFLPALEKVKGACIVNILSMGSLVVVKRLGSYCASKSATHILTETIREELAEKGIKVMAAYMGYVNTQMVPEETKTLKSEPEDIVNEICNGIEKGEERIYPDAITKKYIAENPIKTKFFD